MNPSIESALRLRKFIRENYRQDSCLSIENCKCPLCDLDRLLSSKDSLCEAAKIAVAQLEPGGNAELGLQLLKRELEK